MSAKRREPLFIVLVLVVGHGFGLGHKGAPVATWPGRCADWLRGMKLLEKEKAPAKKK